MWWLSRAPWPLLCIVVSLMLAPSATAQTWTPLPPVGFFVADMTVDDRGDLYAGGFVLVPNGYESPRLAVYRNGAWTRIDPPNFGSVQSIVFDRLTGKLFAGGPDRRFFAGIVSEFSNGVWTELPAPGMGVSRLALDRFGMLYAAGHRIGSAVGMVGRFENGSWMTTLPPGYEHVIAMAFDAVNTLYIGGVLQVDCCSFPDLLDGKVSVFSGDVWTAIDPPNYGFVNQLATGPAGALYVGGTFNPFSLDVGKVSEYQGSGQWASIDPPGFGVAWELEVDDAGVLYAAGGTPRLVLGKVARYADGVWTSMDPAPALNVDRFEAMALDKMRGALYIADSLGNVLKADVASQAQQFTNLIEAVGLRGISNSLKAKLTAAQSQLAAGRTDTARKLLDAFAHEVRAQAGKKIAADQAAEMIAAADRIVP